MAVSAHDATLHADAIHHEGTQLATRSWLDRQRVLALPQLCCFSQVQVRERARWALPWPAALPGGCLAFQVADKQPGGVMRSSLWGAREDVPRAVEFRWRPEWSGDVSEVILHDGSDIPGDLALKGGA